MRRAIQPYADPKHEGNSERYHTGKRCIEADCKNPAGTMWSPHWCFRHNRERMARLGRSLKDAAERAEFNAKVREAAEEAWQYGHEMRGYRKRPMTADEAKSKWDDEIAKLHAMKRRHQSELIKQRRAVDSARDAFIDATKLKK